MSLLSKAKKPVAGPVIMTICGDAGSGKSSLAATMPKPFLIRTEGEAMPQDIPAENLPDEIKAIGKPDGLWMQIEALMDEDHDYKTLIIDSVTGLEAMFVKDVIDNDPKKPRGIQQALGGYGNGRDAVTAMHLRLRKAVEILRERKGMNTVFIAHADTERLDPPDGEGYTRYNLRLHQKSVSPYTDSVDVVGFLKLETFLTGDEGSKKAKSTGDRVLVTYMTAANVSKNRFGITKDIAVKPGENPLTDYIPSLKQEG